MWRMTRRGRRSRAGTLPGAPGWRRTGARRGPSRRWRSRRRWSRVSECCSCVEMWKHDQHMIWYLPMFAGKSGAGKHLVWKLSKIVEDTNNLGLRIGETSNVGVKNFNVQRLDNARASPLLYLAVGDILVVWLVLDKNFNLFKMILT